MNKDYGEVRHTGETVVLSPEALAARKRRSVITAIALFAFVILIFTITMVRLGDTASDFSQQHDLSRALDGDTSIVDDAPTREERSQ